MSRRKLTRKPMSIGNSNFPTGLSSKAADARTQGVECANVVFTKFQLEKLSKFRIDRPPAGQATT
jgi:hypothetical protein